MLRLLGSDEYGILCYVDYQIYHICVVYDLAGSSLVVEALAKLILVTPRGSIYAR